MRYLAAVDTVHTAATACDYLGGRVDDGDAVRVLAVRDDPTEQRDRQEALNVAAVRLVTPRAETEQRDGDPVETILAVAAEIDADEIVMGARAGLPDADVDVGTTTRGVLAQSDRPVVVLGSGDR